MVRMSKIEKGKKIPTKLKSKLKEKEGGSNIGKYKNLPKGDFAGPSGGAPEGTYPINTKKRAKAALAYSRNAPNPEGIKKKVYREYPSLAKSNKKREGK